MYNSEPKDLNHLDRTQLLRLTNDVKQMDILSDKDESFCQCQTYPLVAKAKKPIRNGWSAFSSYAQWVKNPKKVSFREAALF